MLMVTKKIIVLNDVFQMFDLPETTVQITKLLLSLTRVSYFLIYYPICKINTKLKKIKFQVFMTNNKYFIFYVLFSVSILQIVFSIVGSIFGCCVSIHYVLRCRQKRRLEQQQQQQQHYHPQQQSLTRSLNSTDDLNSWRFHGFDRTTQLYPNLDNIHFNSGN